MVVNDKRYAHAFDIFRAFVPFNVTESYIVSRELAMEASASSIALANVISELLNDAQETDMWIKWA